jgi:hypothetical protein
MAIVFHCGCGHLLKARPEFAGKKTKCPHCGEIREIPGSSDRPLAARPAAVGAGAEAAGGPATLDDDGLAPISIDDGPTPALSLAGSTDLIPTVAAGEPPAEPDPLDHAERQYKVLTHKDMGIAARFDAAKVEETLNRLARRGWTLRSAVTLNLPGHAGAHDELVVILER